MGINRDLVKFASHRKEALLPALAAGGSALMKYGPMALSALGALKDAVGKKPAAPAAAPPPASPPPSQTTTPDLMKSSSVSLNRNLVKLALSAATGGSMPVSAQQPGTATTNAPPQQPLAPTRATKASELVKKLQDNQPSAQQQGS